MDVLRNAITVGCLATLLVAVSSGTTQRSDDPQRLLNQKVPILSLRTLDGKLIDSIYFTGKVSLISFMFIGCPPCMKEAPALNEIHREFSTDSLQMLCIAPHTADQMMQYNSETDNRFSRLRKSNNVAPIPYPIVAECAVTKTGRDPKAIGPECNDISGRFSVSGHPVTLLVDAHGIVRKVYEGFSPDPSYPARFKERVRTAIRQLTTQHRWVGSDM